VGPAQATLHHAAGARGTTDEAMKLGAARDQSRTAWRLVVVEVAADSATFSYRLDRNKLRQARSREGRYLLRTNLAEGDPAKLWSHYLLLVAVEEAFKNLKGDLAIRPVFGNPPLQTRRERRRHSRSQPARDIGRRLEAALDVFAHCLAIAFYLLENRRDRQPLSMQIQIITSFPSRITAAPLPPIGGIIRSSAISAPPELPEHGTGGPVSPLGKIQTALLGRITRRQQGLWIRGRSAMPIAGVHLSAVHSMPPRRKGPRTTRAAGSTAINALSL
jgi:hypothetical protein